MRRILITGGCSVTAGNDLKGYGGDHEPSPYAWPQLLGDKLNYKTINVGHGGASNEKIARTVITKVDEILKGGVDSTDIMVGIMWTDPSRFERFSESGESKNVGSWDSSKAVELFYADLSCAKTFFARTLKEILMVQSYLKNRNVKYFMMFSSFSYLSDNNVFMTEFDEFKVYKDVIDFSKFLNLDTLTDNYASLDRNSKNFIGFNEMAYTHNIPKYARNHFTEHAHSIFVEKYLYDLVVTKIL